MSEAPFKIRHEAGYMQVIDSKFLQVFERGKVAKVVFIESFGGKPCCITTTHADPESFDAWKEAKLVLLFERPGPLEPSVPQEHGIVVCCERVVKVTDGSDVPRATSKGARQENAYVVKEVGYNFIHKFLRQPGGRRWGFRAMQTE